MSNKEDHQLLLNGIFEEREAKKDIHGIFESATENNEISIITQEGEPCAAVVPLSLLEESISQKELCELIYKLKLLAEYKKEQKDSRQIIKNRKLSKDFKKKSFTFEELKQVIEDNIEEEIKTKDSLNIRNQLLRQYVAMKI